MKKIDYELKLDGLDIVTHLPDGAGYYESDGNFISFEKVKVTFKKAEYGDPDTDYYFGICVDDMFYIGTDFKLYDDIKKAGDFGKIVRKEGKIVRRFAHISDRAMGVVSAVLKGKIKLSEVKIDLSQ